MANANVQAIELQNTAARGLHRGFGHAPRDRHDGGDLCRAHGIFVVDLLSLLWVSRLGDPKLTAAVGFATQVLFLVSINIGLSIAIGALVSRRG
jgi:hypothetical protein